MNYPDYVKDKKDEIIFKFLSNVADHYDKNTFWRKSQHALYKRKFANIPDSFLIKSFLDYLTHKMTGQTKFVPTVANVSEYVQGQTGFMKHWLSVPLDKEYCRHCRTDEIGKSGGWRTIFFYGMRGDTKRMGELIVSAKCDCELGEKLTGAGYETVMMQLLNSDPNAEVAVDRYDQQLGRKIQARHLTNYHWDQILARGYVRYGIAEAGEDTDRLYPIWESPFWITPEGEVAAGLYGWTIPEHIAQQIPHQNLTAQHKHGMLRRIRRDIQNDGYTGSVPQQIGGNIARNMGDFF